MADKTPRRGGSNPAASNPTSTSLRYPSAPEIVVVAKPDAGLRTTVAHPLGVTSTAGADVSSLAAILKDGVRMSPLFGHSEDRLRMQSSVARAAGVELPELSLFYRVEAPPERAEEVAEQIRDLDVIATAYVKPPAEPPLLNDMTPSPIDAPPVTPNFTASQFYLGAAPAGVEALWAHTRAGGKGNSVRIIDIEGAWRFSHEDLTQVQGGVVGGTPVNNLGWRNHGTAVIGVFGGDENTFGILGISPNSNTRAISIFLNAQGTSSNSSKAIKDAADLLSAGDIILIELHRPGPRFSFQQRDDQRGYIAVEWWEDDFQAIKYATSKGVIVVEAAGNGAENLDDALYNTRPAAFPVGWTNPFNRANRDSGAILVGAGAPPPGTHGRDWGPDRSRLDFSNYGASIDVQGIGREVTTTGYGDLQGGGSEDVWYTETFSGTSSSSPLVVGCVASMQGNRKATGQPVYTPAQVRQRLQTTGSPQQDAPGRPATQRIGNRPNLRQLIGGKVIIKETLKDIKVEKLETKEIKEKELKIESKDKNEKLEKIEKIEKIEAKESKSEFEKIPDKTIEVGGGGFTQPTVAASLEERVAALEAILSGAKQQVEAAPPAPAMVCTAFAGMPVALGPNPFIGTQARFLVRQFGGTIAPNTRIVQWGMFRGLDCGFTCEIALQQLASSVTLALVHFSQPATIQAFNSNGSLAGSAVMTPVQQTVQTFTINGAQIRRVVIKCPANETLLLRFCFQPLKAIKEKIEKIEKVEKLEKPEKTETKDIKDKEKEKEKELKEKEFKETAKEKDKDKDIFEGQQGGFGGGDPFEHFIGAQLRPDLSAGALTGEQDVSTGGTDALSQQLRKDAADAKQAKDNKDIEKLGEQ